MESRSDRPGGSIRASSACSQDQVFTVPVGRVNAAFVPFARPSLRALVVGRSNRRRVVAAVELSLLENIALVPYELVAVTCFVVPEEGQRRLRIGVPVQRPLA